MNDLLALEHMADLRRTADSYRRDGGRAASRAGSHTLPGLARRVRLAVPHRHGTTAIGCEA